MKDTVVEDSKTELIKGKGLDYKLMLKAFSTFEYYFNHLNGLTKSKPVYLLTENSNTKKMYSTISDSKYADCIIDVHDFINMHSKQFPELSNFMGFEAEDSDAQIQDLENEEGDTHIYEAHLSFEEMIIGVKEGRYFQGRLNVSRLVETEALVKINGIEQDILI